MAVHHLYYSVKYENGRNYNYKLYFYSRFSLVHSMQLIYEHEEKNTVIMQLMIWNDHLIFSVKHPIT